jgi:hypothetical protein
MIRCLPCTVSTEGDCDLESGVMLSMRDRLRRLATRAACRSESSSSARARRSTVAAYGDRRLPRSRSDRPRRLTPARSASASWVSPAASRYSRSSAPKLGISTQLRLCDNGIFVARPSI